MGSKIQEHQLLSKLWQEIRLKAGPDGGWLCT
eukprot:COSAG02_NODE_49501_length_326_cov_0.942731_1_plen_31_part_10